MCCAAQLLRALRRAAQAGETCPERGDAGKGQLWGRLVRWGSIASLLGWKLSDRFVSDVYLPDRRSSLRKKNPL